MVRFLFTTVTVFHVPLLVYYCHVSSCFASGLLLSQVRFMFTTCHVGILSRKSLFINMYLVFFSSLRLCYFFVWYSHIESARFVIVYHSCVPIHKTKRSMSRLTNPITPTDFFITENCLLYFYNFLMIVLGVNRSKNVWVPTRNTYPFPYSYAHTEPTRIYIDVCMYHNVHVLILSGMYIHVYTCVHVHTSRVSLWRLFKLDWLALDNGILRLTTWFKESFTYVNLTLMMG
jgi:hypothetical protein